MWLKQLFSRHRLNNDLSEEIREHLEEKIEELVASGMSRKEAAHAARREFGNVTLIEEDSRAAWRWPSLENFLMDVRYGIRMLRKNPGFTTVAVLTLALGIGSNTAIFSLINAVMLRTLPVRNPEQLVVLKWKARQNPGTRNSYFWGGCPGENTFSSSGASSCSFSYRVYEQFHGNRDVFSGVFGFVPPSGVTEITVNGQTSQARGDFVSGNFFSTLGVEAAIGRVLDPLDDISGAPPVVVISHGYWQSRFGSDASVAGKTVLLNGIPFTVSGVAAPGFVGLEIGVPRQFWVALAARYRIDDRFPKERETDAKSVWMQMMGRLKSGVTVQQAEAALSTMFASSVTSGPDVLFKPELDPQIELPGASRGLNSLREEFSKPLFVLMTAVGLILLIACANVAGLMLARAAAREKELAVRFALGAGRRRIVRQLLTESLMLAVAGGGLGILFAYWGARSLAEFLASSGEGAWEINVNIDPRMLAFTVGISCLVGVFSGLAPALRGSGVDLIPALKQRGSDSKRSTRGRERRFGLGAALVVAQVAVSILVLAGAGLLVRTLVNLRSANTGFDARNILLFDIDARLSGDKGSKLGNLYRDIQTRLAGVPGVLSASYSSTTLLSGAEMTTTFRITDALAQSGINVAELPVGPDFFQTMRIPALTGRTFLAADYENSGKPQPMVINQSLARRFFGERKPLGRLLSEGDTKTPDYEVVGIVADTKYDSLRKEVAPTAYLPMGPQPGSFEIRAAVNPRAFIPTVRQVLAELDSNLVLLNAKTQIEQIDQGLYQERLLANLSSLFAALALALACIGLYGLLSYEVTRRTHEIGVRMAMGAEQRNVLLLVVGKGIALAVFGITAGIAAALGVTRYLEAMLYGVKPIDPGTFLCVATLLLGVAVAACYIPARRATKVDPMVALRYE
jgi:predicted permease